MQEFWGAFEFIALAVLFGLQIYFLIIALKKMKMMGGFFPDIRSIHIKRIALDEKGNEIREQSENKYRKEEFDSSANSRQENSGTRIPDIKSRSPLALSIEQMRNLKIEDLRPYVKYISRAYWSRTASDYCISTNNIVASQDAIVSIDFSKNDHSTFGPAKTFTVEEFENIMAKPNVNANRLFEVIRTKTGSTATEIKVLTPGRCIEDGSRWKIVNKCRISI